ncbi:MAG: hypothetical protein DRR16_01650 [Candidatus Parabeggiatoa sp. nov. 3]|nr:MAG: hypothetical protein DRR00_03935 [Gammaproteobacteria bacterium]RKZ68618.1 MAG: hypothetical protein DRQ99_03215 [Gammaproteobacteria bacterium]RKZ89820.1 MAG: hypothetical protein DRR16_01650 [Gammaproteobacteria bacterium]
MHLNATFVKGFRGGMPLPNPTYSGVVGANLRVRPGEGEGGIEVAPGAMISLRSATKFHIQPYGVVLNHIGTKIPLLK